MNDAPIEVNQNELGAEIVTVPWVIGKLRIVTVALV